MRKRGVLLAVLCCLVGCEDAALPQQQEPAVPVAHVIEGDWKIVGFALVRSVPEGEEIDEYPLPGEYEGRFMLHDGVFELRQNHETGVLDRKLGTYFIDDEEHRIIVSV